VYKYIGNYLLEYDMASVRNQLSEQNVDRVVRMPFRIIPGNAFSKVANTINVTELDLRVSNLGSRIVAIGACFEYFRIVRLDVDQFTNVVGPVHYDSSILNVTLGMLEGIHAVAYEPSDTGRTAPPTSLGEMGQCTQFNVGNPYDRIGFRLRKKVLLGTPLKWWNTGSTGASTDALTQGVLWQYTFNNNTNDSTNAPTAHCYVSGLIEFRGMIPPTLSGLERLLKSDEQKTVTVQKKPLAPGSVAVASKAAAKIAGNSASGSVRSAKVSVPKPHVAELEDDSGSSEDSITYVGFGPSV